MLKHFEGKETEHNWLDRERSIIRLRGMLLGDIHKRYEDHFFNGLRNGVLEGTYKPVSSSSFKFDHTNMALACQPSNYAIGPNVLFLHRASVSMQNLT